MDLLVITFVWFFITVISLMFLFRLTIKSYFDFRVEDGDNNTIVAEEEMIPLEPEAENCSEPEDLWNQIEEEEEEQERSKFEFKFKYNNPQFEDFMKKMEVTSTSSDVKFHQLMPEKEEDISFFLEEHQNEAFKVIESQDLNSGVETCEVDESQIDVLFESDSISISDGYSVKEIIIDSESNNLSDDDDEHDDDHSSSSSELEEINDSENKTLFDDDEHDDDDDQSSSSELAEANDSEEKVKVFQEKSLNGTSDSDMDELESLWEHQDLIEQLRMELRKVRAIGLPTILEESETPKSIHDPRNWKIDSMFLREDPMDELQKSYKSYRERMRKFDILIHQKMYAIGFLQLKDPLQTLGSQKLPLTAVFKCQRKKTSDDPSEKLIKEYMSDLETVYVGQTCLSWEFLRWQQEKLQEISGFDHYQIMNQRFNHAAGEFQQFQVLIQRFMENEPFHGARVQNYVKSRCVLRNLLHVPVIKEDETGEDDSYGVTGEELENIVQKSMRVFWEFVKADRDETPVILKGLIGTQIELQNPIDHELMIEIQEDLHKKERKLKEIRRIGKWSVKKPKKHLEGEDRSIQDIFFSKVDMKLVSRVLKVSGITRDRLLWCQKKLNQIRIEERKIQRNPSSFCLFPC